MVGFWRFKIPRLDADDWLILGADSCLNLNKKNKYGNYNTYKSFKRYNQYLVKMNSSFVDPNEPKARANKTGNSIILFSFLENFYNTILNICLSY